MADLVYSADIDIRGAESNLRKLKNGVNDVDKAFDSLRNMVAGIALGSFITNALNLAARLDTLSQSTGIATSTLRGFQQAVSASGGNADQATDAISNLVKNLGDAANGSSELVNAFSQVGVSFNDINNLPTDQILGKVVSGLAGIDDRAKRSATQVKLLSEAVKTVDFTGVNANFGTFSANSLQFADAARSAREAQDKMAEAIDNLSESIVIALKPINDFIASIPIEQIKAFAAAIFALIGAIAGLFVFQKVVAIFLAAKATITALGGVVAAIVTVFTRLIGNFNTIWQSTSQLTSGFARIKSIIVALTTVTIDFIKNIPGIGKATQIAIGVAITAWGYLQGSIEKVIEKVKEYARIAQQFGSDITFGLISAPEVDDPRNDPRAGRGFNRSTAEDPGRQNIEEGIQRAAELLRQQAREASLLNLETSQYVDNLDESLNRNIQAIQLQTRLTNLGEDQREIAQAIADNENARVDAVRQLQQEIDKLQIQAQFANELERNSLNEQIAGFKTRLNATNQLYDAQNARIRESITQLQSVRILEQARIRDNEVLLQSYQDQANRRQQLADILANARDQLQNISTDRGGNKLEDQIRRIRESTERAAQNAARAFANAFQDNGDGLTPERAAELADGLNKIAEAYGLIAQRQIENLKSSESWRDGWKEAFDRYADDASNAANQAKRVFDTFSRGFEDAFVRLAQTGKLSFKDLANSIIADVLRIQAQKMFMSLFGGGGFFGGIFGGLFGKANGGPTEAMKPIIVGERGPELFIPRMAGNVISNQNLTKPSTQTMPTITNVTYNINAVDAPSFRALIARDPQFIYNVSEVGRRGQPNRRLA